MKYNRLSRRMFLQGSGKTIMAIPLLPSLLPRDTWAQVTAAPKRFISLLCSHEIGHNSCWLPNSGNSIASLAQPNRILNPGGGQPAVRWQPLNEFVPSPSTPLAPLYGTSLNSHLQYINIMRGLDFAVRHGHGDGAALGALLTSDGFNGNLAHVPTVDSVLAANRRINPNGRYVFAGAPGGWEGFSRSLNGSPSTRLTYFNELYNSLFDNGNLPESGGGTAPPPTTHPRRDLLSRVLEDYARVINHRNISAADKTALSNAMDKMSDVQRSLAAVSQPTVSCSHRGLARPNGAIAHTLSYADRSKALVDMITASIMCDSNRIFTFGFHVAYDIYSGASPGADIVSGVSDWHQQISHVPFGTTNGVVNWQWVMNQQRYLITRLFAPLVQSLSSAIDPTNGMSYLHNSLVLASYESGQNHSWASHPVIMAGRAGGALSAGNYIDYSDRSKGTVSDGGADNFSADPNSPQFSNNYWGLSYNRLLVTILQAMGLTPAEYENSALNAQVYNRTDIGASNANLTNIGGFNYAFRADRNSSGFIDGFFRNSLPRYDLTQFRNRLALP